jgi:glucose/arabinose dehydrogenase
MDRVSVVHRLRWLAAAIFVGALVVSGCGGESGPASSAGEPTPTQRPVSTPDSPTPSHDPEPTQRPTEVPTPTPTPPPPLLGLATELVSDEFDQPIYVTGAPGTDALFVVEREGIIRLVENGVIRDEPFLDLTDKVWSFSIEQGLLGLAFHPDYAANGRFFVYWTERDFDSQLGEFHATSPTVADPDSGRVLLEIDQPAERHNSGMLQFGPQGLLYLSLGDGATGGRPSQDTSRLLGSILRLDVDSTEPYAIPDENPYDNEIWLHGLRNPWRFSIDAVGEMIYIGDVGQVTFEEINAVPLDTPLANFGWPEMEGPDCQGLGTCESDAMTLPVAYYNHNEGCSVSGGWVYRGSTIPELYGHYFYADWCTGLTRSFRLANGNAEDEADWTEELDLGQVTSFGVDNDFELYVVTWAGELLKIVPLR